jgi:hypothetical protein
MEGPATGRTTQDREAPGAGGVSPLRGDVGLLLVLLLAAAGIRTWLITHTEVAARDSIGYIRYAWQLRERPWQEVLQTSEAHPGYPLAILAVSPAVRAVVRGPESIVMQRSAQLANALAGTLLVLPMFFLGRELFGRAVGFWAALLFQCLPASGRVLSDGLSEGLFLLWAAAALWTAVRALRTGSPFDFVQAGLFAGLSYLTRPEGALIAAVAGAVLLGSQLVAAWRRPWRRVLGCAAGLGLTAAAVASPFVLATGSLTTKPTAHRILESARLKGNREGGGAPLVWGVWWPSRDNDSPADLHWALAALGLELIKACHYAAWLPGLLALWWFRHRFRETPAVWVPALVGLLVMVVLGRMAVLVGYLSDRHTLLVILCGSYWMAAGALHLGARLAARLAFLPLRPFGAGLILLGMIAAALPKTLEPLHANRSGFRQVGFWLAEHTAPSDVVIDPYFWSHYYAGRVFTEGKQPSDPPGHPPLRYVVLERGGSEHVRLRLLPEAERLKERGQLVYHWTGRRPRHRAEVFVYAVPPE